MGRGQFEERLKRVIEEIKESGAILCLLTSCNSWRWLRRQFGGRRQYLRRPLARGELQCIGAIDPGRISQKYREGRCCLIH